MKTLDKQNFAKLILDICANFMRSYQYDTFYDIKRIRMLEEENNSRKFHLYFRRSGCDILFHNIDEDESLHKAYMNANKLVLYVDYISQIDHNSDQYHIQIIKDDFDYLQNNSLLIE